MARLIRLIIRIAIVLIIAAVGVFVASNQRIATRYALPTHAPFAAIGSADSATLARGEHFATAIGKCEGCHGADFGGKVFIDGPAVFGHFVAPNITRGAGGLGPSVTDADYELAIRHGLAPNGRALVFMPSDNFSRLDDADLSALVIYLEHLPPVDRNLAPTRFGPVARALLIANKLPIFAAARIDQNAPHPPAPPIGPTRDYGAYMVVVSGCTGCHGAGLGGGHVPGTPSSFKAASNLTPSGIGQWTEADFFRALRQGVTPSGAALDPFMPVQETRLMTDTEIHALWAYLRTIPPRPFGSH